MTPPSDLKKEIEELEWKIAKSTEGSRISECLEIILWKKQAELKGFLAGQLASNHHLDPNCEGCKEILEQVKLSERQRCSEIAKKLIMNHRVYPVDENIIDVDGLRCSDWFQRIIQPDELLQKINSEGEK